jgi:hypothetical protein
VLNQIPSPSDIAQRKHLLRVLAELIRSVDQVAPEDPKSAAMFYQ